MKLVIKVSQDRVDDVFKKIKEWRKDFGRCYSTSSDIAMIRVYEDGEVSFCGERSCLWHFGGRELLQFCRPYRVVKYVTHHPFLGHTETLSQYFTGDVSKKLDDALRSYLLFNATEVEEPRIREYITKLLTKYKYLDGDKLTPLALEGLNRSIKKYGPTGSF